MTPDKTPSEAELLPCPFCGEAAKHSFNSLYGDMSMASCKSCGATAYAPKWNRRAVLAKWGQPAQARAGAVPLTDEYTALVCDYCGALTPDPWHSSGMLHGKMSKHIHSCDACAARGAARAQDTREPLTPEQIDQAIAELGLDYLADAHATNRAVLRKLCRHAHGIKGGQHGTDET